MSLKKVKTVFKGYGSPIFPSTVNKLNKIFNKRLDINAEDLWSVCKVLSGFDKTIGKPITQDKYEWFSSAVFRAPNGRIVVFFPKNTDGDGGPCSDMLLDRSVGIYKDKKVTPYEIKQVLEHLYLEMKLYIIPEKRKI